MKNIATLVAVLLGGFGVGLMFFPAPAAEADLPFIKSVGVEVAQHQNVTDLPVHTFHNMALVFPEREPSSTTPHSRRRLAPTRRPVVDSP